MGWGRWGGEGGAFSGVAFGARSRVLVPSAFLSAMAIDSSSSACARDRQPVSQISLTEHYCDGESGHSLALATCA